MRMRLEPEDDLLHPPDDDPNYNESRYYNFFAGDGRFGGWCRMGNRPNEGYAEMTVCLYLPDGRVGFMFGRPRIEGHTAHDAAGLRFEVLEPYAAHRVTYAGRVCVLAHPCDMADPKAAFAENPHAEAVLELRLDAMAQPFGGEPEYDEDEEPPPGKAHGFATGHTEQHMAVTGSVQVGDETFVLGDGLGFRDHSWGPRVWQSIWWYRWLNMSFGNLGLAFTVRGEEGFAGRHLNGFVYDLDRYPDRSWVAIRSVDLDSEYDDEAYVLRNRVQVRTDDHAYDVTGEVWSAIPLRNRRNGLVTRITEGVTRWTYGDRPGVGLTEHLDQIIEGVPVGVAAGA